MSESLAVGKGFSKAFEVVMEAEFKCLSLTDLLPLRTLEANQNSQVRALKAIYFPITFLRLMHTHSVSKNNQQDMHVSFGAGITLYFQNILSPPGKPFLFFPPFLLT